MTDKQHIWTEDCDLLVAGRGAFLQVGEIRQGLQAPMNMAWLCSRRHG